MIILFRIKIIIIIFILLTVSNSGCINSNSDKNTIINTIKADNTTSIDVILGEPLVLSGKFTDYEGNVTIVLKGDNLNENVNATILRKDFRYSSNDIKHNWESPQVYIGSFRIYRYDTRGSRRYAIDRQMCGKAECSDLYQVSNYHYISNYIENVGLECDRTISFSSFDFMNAALGYGRKDTPPYENFLIECNLGFLWDEFNIKYWLNTLIENAKFKEVKSENGEYETQFDTSELKEGIYFIEIYADKFRNKYQINIIPPNIEELSVNRINEVFGTPVNVIVVVRNPENEDKLSKLYLFVDGILYKSKSLSISPNSFSNVIFTIDELPVGTHKIKVGTLEKIIEIKPVPNLALQPVTGEIGIGRTLNIEGTSNLPDNTKVNLIMKKGDGEDILTQKTATINSGRFGVSFDTEGAEETIYTVFAKTQDGLSDSIKVTFIRLLSKFEITDLSLSHSSVIVGTPITATATVKNNGNIAGSAELTLKVDGIKKESRSVTVEPNRINQISFTINEGIGVHETSIDGLAITKNFEVKSTPNLILDYLSNDIRIGDKLIISGTTNMPDGVSILITAKTESAQLTPQTTVTNKGKFSTTFNTADAKQGIYKINAKTTDGTSSDIISVYIYEIPPELSISVGLSQKQIVTGQSEKVIVTMTNPGGTQITKVLQLLLDGEFKERKTLTINDIEIVEFILDNPSVGTHLVDVNGYQTQFIVLPVLTKSEIGFQLRTDRTTIKNGESSILTLSATNIITKTPMTAQLILTIPAGVSVTSTELIASGSGQYSTTFTIQPGDTKFISATIQGNENGNFIIEGRLVYHFGDISEKHDETQRVEIRII